MVHFCLAKNIRPAFLAANIQIYFPSALFYFFFNLFFAQFLLESNLSLNLAILAPSPLASYLSQWPTNT